ncbi:MAG: hypothetical protein B7Y45_10280 [Sphingomonas sp. 28-66-16]|nr:MAG: hypothetical protein B7Y45_10280 [Sphingomonas sp. 28-66-16]
MRAFAIDPSLLPLLEALRPFDFDRQSLAEIRHYANLNKVPTIAESISLRTEHIVPTSSHAPEVRVLSYRPSLEDTLPVYLHIHGGGFVMGTPDRSEARNRMISDQANCAVFSVDYRLAPETAFPGPLEDCYAVLKWIVDNAALLRIDPSRIAVGGESAGGGLAAALSILARDRAELHVGFQVLTYPMLDDRTAFNRGMQIQGRTFHVWTPENNRFGWQAMLGSDISGTTDISPYAAPGRLKDFANLPATFLAVGALDLFLSENLEFIKGLANSGVATETAVYPGAFHGFILSPTASVARRYHEAVLRALRGFFQQLQ